LERREEVDPLGLGSGTEMDGRRAEEGTVAGTCGASCCSQEEVSTCMDYRMVAAWEAEVLAGSPSAVEPILLGG
jgi:hypothetical protein